MLSRREQRQGTSTYVTRAGARDAGTWISAWHLMRTGGRRARYKLEFMSLSLTRARARALANFSLDILVDGLTPDIFFGQGCGSVRSATGDL